MKLSEKLKIPEYIGQKVDKYKYVLLVCAIGLVLLLLPTGGEKEAGSQGAPAAYKDSEAAYDPAALAASLEEVFASIDGVGKTKVVLTLKNGYESVYVYNETSSESEKDGQADSTADMQLVTIGSGASEQPVVERVNSPSFLGAVVICEGGDSAKVQLALTDAVRSLTGIPASNIVILKMKQ